MREVEGGVMGDQLFIHNHVFEDSRQELDDRADNQP